jgi:hypothetical protein
MPPNPRLLKSIPPTSPPNRPPPKLLIKPPPPGCCCGAGCMGEGEACCLEGEGVENERLGAEKLLEPLLPKDIPPPILANASSSSATIFTTIRITDRKIIFVKFLFISLPFLTHLVQFFPCKKSCPSFRLNRIVKLPIQSIILNQPNTRQSIYYQHVIRLLRSFHSLAMTLRHSLFAKGERRFNPMNAYLFSH